MEDCIFCRIARGELPCHKIYENDRVIAFEDISPLSEGHTLIIPKRHAENLFDMAEEDLTAVHLASQKIARAIRRALAPTGVAVLQLNGRGVNQVVMHYHIHLIPRLPDTHALPFSEWKTVPGDGEGLRRTAAKIVAALT